MSAVAVHDALLESCDLQTDIKWPNDIVADEKKLCGILAETVESIDGSAVVVGIGINLTQLSFPTELENVATSVEAVLGRPVDLNQFWSMLFGTWPPNTRNCKNQTDQPIWYSEWCERSSYCNGKRIRCTMAMRQFCRHHAGTSRRRRLIVELDNGRSRTIRAGDISSVRPIDLDGRQIISNDKR